jgi:hypothetical protein
MFCGFETLPEGVREEDADEDGESDRNLDEIVE